MRALNGVMPPWLAALEESLVAFAIALIVQLLLFGFPPTVEAFYISGLTGALFGLKTWVEARGLQNVQTAPSGGP